MPTLFGRFVASKKFSTFFLLSMPVITLLTGFQTEQAIGFFLGRRHLWGIPSLLLLILSVLSVEYNRSQNSNGKHLTYFVKYLSCFLIYDVLLIVPWWLISLMLPIPDAGEAVVTLFLILASGVLVIVGRKNTKKVVTTTYNVFIDNYKNSCRIALISDLHLGLFVREDHVKKVVQGINSIKPDVVIIAGDILDVDHSILNDHSELNAIEKQLRMISSVNGTYLILGNHDPNIENHAFRNFINESNIRLLHNEAAELKDIILVGRTDATSNIRKYLQEILPQIRKDKPVILVDHNPQGIRDASQCRIPLVLCGHTHKGQFFPMDLFAKWANGKHYFYGHETFQDTQAIISSGAGYFNLPIRVGSRNEIVQINVNDSGVGKHA